MEGRERQQAQSEADASERAELARRGRAQVRHISSEASPPPSYSRAFGRRLVNVAPAVMASRPEPIQPLNTQLLSA